jgi:hypothetical protein
MTEYGREELPWVGCDLDQTLAKYEPGDYMKYGPSYIGPPIPKMVERIKRHLANGDRVKIMTARLDPNNDEPREVTIRRIQDWCEIHIGERLEVTDRKDFKMILLYDDRARQIIANTGIIVSAE